MSNTTNNNNSELPPIKSYSTREEALDDVNKWALPRGYAFTIRRSQSLGNERTKLLFGCDLKALKKVSAPMKEKGQGLRNKSSKGTGCNYSILCVQSLNKNSWEIRYREPWIDQSGTTIDYSCHNHPPSSGTGVEHPVLRRTQLKGERRDAVEKQYNAGNKPRSIQSYLKTNFPRDLAVAQDIRNAVAEFKRSRKNGRNCTEVLLTELEQKGWISRPIWCEDEPNRLLSVFFAHPRSIEYLQLYCKVLIIDCTYNTNSGEMPLFEVIGIDASSKSFCVSFEFLPGETEGDLIQALNHLNEMLGEDVRPGVILTDKAESIRSAVKAVFPEWKALLCIWHANKSVSEKCKGNFATAEEWDEFMKGWTSIVSSPTVEIYLEKVKKFKAKWTPTHLEDYMYIEQNWLDSRNRACIVSAWTNEYLHLGNTATSRAEGIHATIKRDIETKNIDLLYA